jgi:hypothetical protein
MNLAEAIRILRQAIVNCDAGIRTGSWAPSVIREQIEAALELLEEEETCTPKAES